MYKVKKFIILIIPLIYSFCAFSETLDIVKNRGFLKCGISEKPLVGFSIVNDKAEWSGFDVEMCRAVAAAIFSDSKKVEFITTSSKSRFPVLASGEIDMLARNTTWTFSRDVNLGFEFVGVNYYDGQGFMIPSSLGISSAKQLDGATICIEIGTTKSINISSFFNINNIKYKTILIDSNDEAIENYLIGRCDVYSTIVSELAIFRSKTSNPSSHLILPEIISKEPLGPLVRHGDHEWGDVVRWSLNTMIIAEELGLTSENVDNYIISENPRILRLLGEEGNFGDMLELDYKWAYNIIKQVGDYGTVFDNNIGRNSVLGLNRGLNALWKDGGILYSPPFK